MLKMLRNCICYFFYFLQAPFKEAITTEQRCYIERDFERNGKNKVCWLQKDLDFVGHWLLHHRFLLKIPLFTIIVALVIQRVIISPCAHNNCFFICVEIKRWRRMGKQWKKFIPEIMINIMLTNSAYMQTIQVCF